MTTKDRKMIRRMFIFIMRGIFALLSGSIPAVKEGLTQDCYTLEVDLIEWSNES